MKYWPRAVNGSAFKLRFLLFGISSIFCSSGFAGELRSGSQYRIIRPMYLMAVYNDVENKVLSKETARGYLHTTELYNTRWVAFQVEIPVGTVMTIIEPTSKVLPLPFFARRYLVYLEPDASRGLDVELALNRGLEGNLDGLNPEFFSKFK